MINQVTMEGEIYREPKIFPTRSGKDICEIQITNIRNVGLGESRKVSRCMITAVFFGKLAEFAKELRVGEKIVAHGSLDYQVRETQGEVSASHKLMVSEFVICEPKK